MKADLEFVNLNGASSQVLRDTIDIVADLLVNEPPAVHLGVPRTEAHQIYSLLVPSIAKEGLSHAVVDRTIGQVVCVALRQDYTSPFNEEVAKLLESTVSAPHWNISVEMHDWFEKTYKPVPGQIINPFSGGPRRGMLRKGLLNTIVLYGLQFSLSQGFTQSLVECTSSYSVVPYQRTGSKIIRSTSYKDFVWEGRRPFEGMPAEHPQVSLVYNDNLKLSAQRFAKEYEPLAKL